MYRKPQKSQTRFKEQSRPKIGRARMTQRTHATGPCGSEYTTQRSPLSSVSQSRSARRSTHPAIRTWRKSSTSRRPRPCCRSRFTRSGWPLGPSWLHPSPRRWADGSSISFRRWFRRSSPWARASRIPLPHCSSRGSSLGSLDRRSWPSAGGRVLISRPVRPCFCLRRFWARLLARLWVDLLPSTRVGDGRNGRYYSFWFHSTCTRSE